MVQVSGSRFKLLYSNWYEIDNLRFPISNGLHSEVVDWIKKTITEKNLRHFNEDFLTIREIDDQFLYHAPDSGYWFRISNFYYHFCKVKCASWVPLRCTYICYKKVETRDLRPKRVKTVKDP